MLPPIPFIALAGPTASGKSALALALARRLGLAPEDAVTGLALARALLVLRDSKDDADASP